MQNKKGGPENHRIHLIIDVGIITLSILFAVLLVKTNSLQKILESTQEIKFLGSFITGMFFTSVFTTVPAIATLGKIAASSSVFSTAFFGALGAIVGDLIIFQFIRGRLSDHTTQLWQHNSYGKRVKHLLKLRYFRWITFLVGGLIIASPFPDELGISLMGFSKMKTNLFVVISFIFNFIGIVLIGMVAQAV